MMHKQENIWVSIFERSGQRFICGVCGFAGEFNSFRQAFSGGGTEVLFFCHSCGNALIFDTETKSMRANSGEMIRPEVSLGDRWPWIKPKILSLAALGVSLVILALIGFMFFRMESRIGHLDDRLIALSTPPAQVPGTLGRVDFKDPSAQEIGQGYAILPRSATSVSEGWSLMRRVYPWTPNSASHLEAARKPSLWLTCPRGPASRSKSSCPGPWRPRVQPWSRCSRPTCGWNDSRGFLPQRLARSVPISRSGQ